MGWAVEEELQVANWEALSLFIHNKTKNEEWYLGTLVNSSIIWLLDGYRKDRHPLTVIKIPKILIVSSSSYIWYLTTAQTLSEHFAD